MKIPSYTRVFRGIISVAAILLAAAWMPAPVRAEATLPSVSGILTIHNVVADETLTIHVQARILSQGDFLIPSGTVLISETDGELGVFEVTRLDVSPVEVGGVVVAARAEIVAENRETGQTLELGLFDEDEEAAGALPADYNHPFSPGDSVIYLSIGGVEYETASLHVLQSTLKMTAQPEQPAG